MFRKTCLLRLPALLLTLTAVLAFIGGCEPKTTGGEVINIQNTKETIMEGDAEGSGGVAVSGKEGDIWVRPDTEAPTSTPNKPLRPTTEPRKWYRRMVIASVSPGGPVKGAKDFAAKSKRKSEIEDKHRINIDFVDVAGALETYYQFYIAKAQAKEALGDICEIGTAHTYPGYILKKYAQPLDEKTWKLKDDSVWNVAKNNELKYKNKYYMMAPITYPDINNFLNTPVLFFNKYLLKEAGYNENQLYTWQANNQWTWDKFAEVARKINGLQVSGRKDIKGMGADGGVGSQFYRGFMMSADTGGGHVLPAEQRVEYTLESTGAKLALNFVYDLFFKERLGLTITTAKDQTTNFEKFKNGTLGFYAAELQQGGKIRERQIKSNGDPFGVVLYPIPKDRGININDYRVHIRNHTVLAVPFAADINQNNVAAAIDWYAPYEEAVIIDEGSYDEILCDTQSRETLKLINKTAKTVYDTDIFSDLFPSDYQTGPPNYRTIDVFLRSIRSTANNRVNDAYK